MAAVGVVVVLTPLLIRPVFDRSGRLVSLRDGAWTAGPRLTSSAEEVKVSPAGTVWVSSHGLLRLDGGRFTPYGAASFGTRSSSLNSSRNGFAFRGEEVWAAMNEGVVRFDGARWRLYPEALRTRDPLSIVANAAGVWVIDLAGNLSHFDGAVWSVTPLASALPVDYWGLARSAARPALALTSDGALWLAWRGLWRFAGNNWSEFQPDGLRALDAQLVGAGPDRLWLVTNGVLDRIALAGQVADRYSRAELALTPSARILRVESRGDRICVATSEGLRLLDGKLLRTIPGPNGAPVISNIAIAPDGAVWAVAEPPVNATSMLTRMTLTLVVLLSVISVLLVGRSRIRRSAPYRQGIEQAAGAPAQAPAGLNAMRGLCLAAVLVIVGFMEWHKYSSPAAGPGRTSLFGAVVTLAILVVAVAFSVIPLFFLNRALHSGDYAGALWWSRYKAFGAASRAQILLLAGQPVEAEQAAREALAAFSGKRSRNLSGIALDFLGCALTDQGRYDEARPAFEGAIELYVGGGALHSFAEWHLRQGIEPQKALDMVERSLTAKSASVVENRLDKYEYGVRWATKAWALALLKRRGDAESAIRTALDKADRNYRGELAGLHWRIAMAWLALERISSAVDEFRTARDLDPAGKYGKLATQGLEEHSIWKR